MPDPRARDIHHWLRWLTPNHPTLLVQTAWACAHPFRADAPVAADRAWMRAALADPSRYVYVATPVAVFRLGGLSSGLPSWRQLRQRIAEPTRTPLERIAEVAKFLLKPLEPLYPWIMRLKSTLAGLLL